ncbi:Starch-binding associating with outer membrane [Fodinibius roseus]|uniref:Starch-binding associating with outer membrane n=1 Tax=Fodinibius roseus TaxID=1194090 RepID=A0A1M5DT89_9BACT|nr:RagB/SusD family nutrient uptake outer membrane protein [Fodinibius roseus]SHF70125.1 Starch-binding associating with outer membrane [Fodinibius roseus]
MNYSYLKDIKVGLVLAILVAIGTSSCGDTFLEPDPKSFLTPQNTLIDRSGFEAVLLANRRALGTEFYGFHAGILSEYYFTDIAVNAAGPSVHPHNMERQITPTGDGSAKIIEYWDRGFDAVNYANIVISNIDKDRVNWQSDEERNTVLAEAYFHRSYWYYRLVHQFGDVPLVLEEVQEPRLDFNTFTRESILTQIKNDMEFAVQWLPRDVEPGRENRAAGYHLLTKIYLSLREFQNAEEAATQVIDNGSHALMTDRFGNGPYADNPDFNVLWDLHQKENISSSGNTEMILASQDQIDTEGNRGSGNQMGTQMIRNTLPVWWWGRVRDPNGAPGATDGPAGNPLSDSLGRGSGFCATVPYYNYTIWQDSNDLRHSEVNWFSKDDFYYNNPSSEYYGEPFVGEFIQDTIRSWYPFAYNKLYVRDEVNETRKQGGHSDWYIFRLAETYLLRAEAHYWQGEMGDAAGDINVVRERAQATPVNAGEVTIGYIFDERARELYMETPRKTELTRVAYIMAQSGRNGYSIDNMSQDNWYYDRVTGKNVYYREELTYGANTYRIRPYHVYWPVPQDEIDANVQGNINQNEGYSGAEDNVPPLDLSDLE